MDPLSITASIIALFQAGDRLSGLLAKLRPLLAAPEEVNALVNEVSDIKIVLGDLKTSIRDLTESNSLPMERAEHLQRIFDNLATVLLQLETLIADCFLRLSGQRGAGRPKVHRMAWVRKRSQVEKLRQQLRDLRSTITAQLAGVNLSSQISIRVAVNQITVTASDLQTQHIESQRYITGRFDEHGSMLSQILQSQHSTQLMLGETSHALVSQDDSPSRDNSLQHDTAIPVESPSSYQKMLSGVGFNAIRYQRMSCAANCECTCHHQRLLKPTMILNQILGRLFIGYTGAPFLDRRCDNSLCRRRSVPAVHVIYYFPQWLFMRAVFLSISTSLTPSISLTLPRIIPAGSTIFRYIRLGNTDGVKDLFCQGQASPVDICGASGLTLLSYSLMSYALYGGCIEVCEILISEGADPFAVNDKPLTSSAADDAWDMIYDYSMEKPLKNAIKKLVPEPSNLASRSFTRLHKAVLGITTEPLGTILRASRASINDADSSGRSVLHWAAHMGDGEMLNAILRCGAEPNLPCIAGRTPMHYAAKCGSEECVVSLIAAGANLDPKDSEGETPLHLASDRARNRVVELLLKAGADITLGNKYGEIPLAYAATENNREGVSIFLQYGADIDATDDRGYTPLLDAIWANAHDVIEFLLEKGAHYNVKTKDSMTVLHFAARYGDIRTIELLEERRMLGVHPTAINTEGYTALSLLSQRADMSGELAETFGALLFSINPDPRDDMSNFGLVVEDNSRTAEQEFTDAVEYLHDSEAFLGGLNGRQGEEQDALRRVESDGNEDVFADTVEFL